MLIDEAYHDYVTDPSHRTPGPARDQGPAGDRGPDVLEGARHGRDARRLRHRAPRHDQAAAAWEGAERPERGRDRGRDRVHQGPGAARRASRRATPRRAGSRSTGSPKAGFPSTDSQTNFIFVDIKRPAKGFRDACREQGVLRGPRLPALREEPRADLHRDARRDEAGGGRLREGARGQGQGGLRPTVRRAPASMDRRGFLQTVGAVGAASTALAPDARGPGASREDAQARPAHALLPGGLLPEDPRHSLGVLLRQGPHRAAPSSSIAAPASSASSRR